MLALLISSRQILSVDDSHIGHLVNVLIHPAASWLEEVGAEKNLVRDVGGTRNRLLNRGHEGGRARSSNRRHEEGRGRGWRSDDSRVHDGRGRGDRVIGASGSTLSI